MALSGTFYGTTGNEYIRPKIVWKATQSVSGNYSTVTATLYYSRTNSGYTTKGTGSFSLTINGNKASASKAVTITYNSNTVAITHKVQVAHNANGSKSITISATGSISGTTLSSTSISDTVTLDTIPRATTPTLSSSSVNMGSSVTISTPRASSSFTHDLAYKFAGSDWKSIATGVGTSYTWTVPNLSSSIPNATSGTMSIRCITKNGSTTIGTKTVNMTIKTPSSTGYVPTISSVSVTENTSGLAAQFGAFIQNKSRLRVVISAAGAAGSTIKSYSTTFQGETYTGSSFTTDVLSKSGTHNMVTTVTDSRGRTVKKTTAVTVLAYSKPKIKEMAADRFNEDVEMDPSGDKVIVTFDYSAPSLRGSSSYAGNTLDIKVSYKRSTSNTWETGQNIEDAVLTQAQTVTIDDTLSADYQYDVMLELTDYFGAKTSAVVVVPSAEVIMDIKANGKGIAFGKTAEHDGIDFGWPVVNHLLWDGNVSSITQGSVMNENQTIPLSEAISAQPTGAVFAWSYYDTENNRTENYNWRFFFIPKAHVLRNNGTGVYMSDAYLGFRKYLYISDTSVKGHGNNDNSTAADSDFKPNGITVDNNKYVLRYVVGV